MYSITMATIESVPPRQKPRRFTRFWCCNDAMSDTSRRNSSSSSRRSFRCTTSSWRRILTATSASA